MDAPGSHHRTTAPWSAPRPLATISRQQPSLLAYLDKKLTLAAVVVASSLLATLAVPQTANGAARCAQLRIHGPASLVQALRGALRDAGVVSRPDCAELSLVVSTEENGEIRVVLTDADGRREARNVSDVSVAGVWVETWLDSTEPLSAPTGRGPPTETSAAETPESDGSTALVAARSHRRDGNTLTLGALGHALIARDGLGGGIRVFGCVEVGPFCVGASSSLVSLQRGHQRRDGSGRDNYSGWVGDGLATVAAEFHVGPLSLTPHVDVGVAWRRLSLDAGQDGDDDDAVEFRVGAGMLLAVPVTRQLALTGAVFAAVEPFAIGSDNDRDELTDGRTDNRWSPTGWTVGIGFGVALSL